MRFRYSPVLCCFSATVFSLSALGQTPSAPRDPSALAAVHAAVLALGGTTALQGVDNCVAQGQVTRNGSTGTFKWENSGADFHYEETMGGTTSALVSNQGSPATVTGTQVQTWPAHFGTAAIPLHLIGLRLARYAADPTVTLTLLPSDPVADAGVFRVQTGFPQHANVIARKIQEEWRISQTTGLPVAIREKSPGYPIADVSQTSESDLSNYQRLAGMLVPTHIDQYIGKTLLSSYDISMLQCGAPINPGDFTAPAATAPPAVAGGGQ
jgi:hypothetical protein